MKPFTLFVSTTLLGTLCVAGVSGEETLDTLLPPPFWFRSRAEKLNIDAQTRERIKKSYRAAEPKYYEIKGVAESWLRRINLGASKG